MKKMADFCVTKTKSGYRLGQFKLKDCEKTIVTPLCLLYTKSASAPNLARDVLNKIHNVPTMMMVSLQHVVENQSSVEGFQKGIAEFAGMKGYQTVTFMHDPAVEVPGGYNTKSNVAVWGKGGKSILDVESFMKLQAACLPQWYQSLSDGDTNKDSGNKRCQKSVNNTLDFLDKCLEKQQEITVLESARILGVIGGGFNLTERLRSARETASRPVHGFCIEGFHNFGPKTEQFSFEEIEEILVKSLNELPEEKPRFMPSLWSPQNVLKGIKAGIDVFDSSYPSVISERGSALVFDFKLPENGESPSQQENDTKTELLTEICLKDEIYKEDFSPLLEGCSCYTCSTFTKAYVNHLLNTKELLAGTLLTIHNFHHYFRFFEAIQESLQKDQFDDFFNHISKLT